MNENKGEEDTGSMSPVISSESNSNESSTVGKKRSAPSSLLPTTVPHVNGGAFADRDTEQHAIDEAERWKKEDAFRKKENAFKSSLPHTAFWSNKIKELSNAFQSCGGSDTNKNIIKVLRTIPHMQSELGDLEQYFLQEEGVQQHQTTPQKKKTPAQDDLLLVTREELRADDQRFYDRLPSELKTEFLHSVTLKNRESAELKTGFLHSLTLKNREIELKNREIELIRKLNAISTAANRTEVTLFALSSLSQAEGSLTQNTTAANQRRQSKILRDEQVQDMLKDEDKSQQYPSGPGRTVETIIKECGTFKHLLDKQSLQKSKTSLRLASVSEVFQLAFASANILNKEGQVAEDGEYKSKIKKSVSTLKGRFRSALEKRNNNNDPANSSNSGEKLSFPGPTSHEVDGVQPIFMALLAAVADCVQLDLDLERGDDSPVNTANPPSPPKTVSEQKIVYGGEVRRERKCDACVWKRGRYLVVMLDSSMHLTIEIKPGQRAAKSIAELRREAMDQSLSHSAKSLQDCLRFADGAGVPSHVTSVIGTMVYIEVLQLRLVYPGKDNSHVEMVSSGPLPLVSQDLFDSWFASDKRSVSDSKLRDLEDMKKVMFTDADLSVDKKKHDVPLGLKALYTLMASSRQELVGPKWEDVSPHLGHLLGTGTFGMVFHSKDDPEHAIKVSKSGLRYFIKNEAVILRSLAEVHDRPTSIPQLLSSGLLEVTIGRVSCKLPAIAMKPVGLGIYPILLSKKSCVCSIIDCIRKDVSEALDFLHSKDIAHNDISDRNILLVHDEGAPSSYRALLVDFSVASRMYGKRSGLTGTPPFVHREVHTNYHWFPVPEYDKTSLGLTLVVFLARGVIPWENLSDRGPTDDNGVYDKRITAAITLLDEKLKCTRKNLSLDAAHAIKGLINLDNEKFLYRCKCSSTTSCGQRCGCRAQRKAVCSVLCACYDANFHCQNRGKKQQQDIVADSNDPFERDLFEIVSPLPSASP